MSATTEERLARLEAIEEIKALKHRYLRACDAKRPDEFRDCFIASGAVLDYGPRIGKFTDADGIAEVFTAIALQRVDDQYVVLDMHHALHADIQVLGDGEASGAWTLRFRQVDRRRGTETVSAIEYADRYRIEDGAWRIASSVVTVLWSLTTPLPEGHVIVESFG
ncbi:nuclear transport factor 2 family protein [Nocardioides sp. AE5]|uniref:nuclear transport factor 2 family protein n=1 Tax=Nocardioides sp. AE5 TaxID=2962573 RepID=UPI0028828F3D|nr:nuclear transport factor 2 family protein [Nocardioides sp. AE5]MDT0203233.1 nuclear transport factor 2 family protein [Nocardioides sp. AE5]